MTPRLMRDRLHGVAGHMAQATRDFDWAATPLGPIERWPISLLTSVRFMLGQGHAVCMFWGPELTMLYNDAYAPILGAKEPCALGTPFRVIWSDVWEELQVFVGQAMSGIGTYSEEMPLIMNRNGYDEETFWTFSYSPLHDDHGNVAGIMNVTVDATSLVLSRRKQEIMQREMVHRIKNTLAVTSAVVSSSLRTAESLQEARTTIARRIAALSEVQSHFNSENGAEVAAVVSAGMSPHLDSPGRLVVNGPKVQLTAEQTVGLSLAIYELATNAMKYGSLSCEAGKVSIRWWLDEDDRFNFLWQESGGPPVAPPRRRGFGSRLTNVIVAAYFKGEGVTTYETTGIQYCLTGHIEASAR